MMMGQLIIENTENLISYLPSEKFAKNLTLTKLGITSHMNTFMYCIAFSGTLMAMNLTLLLTKKNSASNLILIYKRYDGHSLSRKAVDRIFNQIPRKFKAINDKMGFEDFVWYLLSEEDKTTRTSIEYWFKVLDLDDNGIVT